MTGLSSPLKLVLLPTLKDRLVFEGLIGREVSLSMLMYNSYEDILHIILFKIFTGQFLVIGYNQLVSIIYE